MIFHAVRQSADRLHLPTGRHTPVLCCTSVQSAPRPDDHPGADGAEPPRLPLYGLDIETDTSQGGLDPRRAGVIAVAVCGNEEHAGSEHVVTRESAGSEASVLRALDRHLAGLEPGILVTWNGSRFDLPFIAERARRLGLDLGLRLYESVPTGATGAVAAGGRRPASAASWYCHGHLDALRVYRWLAGASGASCSLKVVARREGLDPVTEVAAAVHLLNETRLRRYVASDARVARILAEIRWDTAQGFVESPVLAG